MAAKPSADWVRHATGPAHRFEARLSGRAYGPHRHDTYTIALTLEGVQRFDYRGSARDSLPGQVLILHPDELHDGRAGSDIPFRYRAMDIAPCAIQDVLGGIALPFIHDAISNDPRLVAPIHALLRDLSHALEPLEYGDALYDLASAMQRVAIRRAGARRLSDVNATERARDYLQAHFTQAISLEALATASGSDRWQLSRDFRVLYGTTPHRYLIQRRLSYARQAMLRGCPVADIAIDSGFADQSHFIRHFRRTYGLTPGAWLQLAQP